MTPEPLVSQPPQEDAAEMGGDEPVVLEVTVAGKHAQSVADLLRGIADGTVVNVRRLAPCPEQTYNLCPLAAVADAQHPAHQ